MLTEIVIVSPVGPAFDDYSLVLGESNTSPLQVRNIDGLGPVEAQINTLPLGVSHGEAFGGGNIGKRNIVLTLGLNPNWEDENVASLRKQLYTMFMTLQPVILRFISTHLPTVEILGYVETFNPNIFAKDSEIQIGIICPDPDFVSVTETTIVGTVGDGFGYTDLEYEGTATAGFVVDITENATTPAFTGEYTLVMNNSQSVQFRVTGTVDNTEFIRLNTKYGEKAVERVPLPSGVHTSLLSTIYIYPFDANWPQLRQGNNEMLISAPLEGQDQDWTLKYYARYGGL